MPPKRMSIGGSVLYSAALAFIAAGGFFYLAFATLSTPGNFAPLFILGVICALAGFGLVIFSRRTGYV